MEAFADEDDVQGDITRGFRRGWNVEFHQAFLFVHSPSADATRSALRDLLERDLISSAAQVEAYQAPYKDDQRDQQDQLAGGYQRPLTFVNVGFTGAGLRQLGVNTDRVAFSEGLAGRSSDLNLLGSPDGWEVGHGDDLHLVLNLGSSDATSLEILELEVRALLSGLRVVFEQRGAALAGNTEHFGFRDGISQPFLDGAASRSLEHPPGARQDAYPDLEDIRAQSARLDETAAELVELADRDRADPPAEEEPAPPRSGTRPSVSLKEFLLDDEDERMHNGSFMVWVKFRQRPERFWPVCRRIAEALAESWGRPVAPSDAAALLMGRWPDGTSLQQAPVPGYEDGFVYLAPSAPAALPADPSGVRCPFASHARKMNPRLSMVDRHRILRRGIPFGPAVPLPGERADVSEAERGLLFVAYQTSIEEQFEFLLGTWANSNNEPEEGASVDPIISQRARDGVVIELPRPRGAGSVRLPIKNDWIEPAGGVYLFVPSLSALRVLAP